MINPDDITKRYYKIGEVAKMFGVSTSLIRYWESEFTSLKPIKSKSGIRKYQKEDILVIDRIFKLVKVNSYTLEGAKKILKNQISTSSKNPKSRLLEIKNELESLRRSLLKMKDEFRKQ